MDCPIPPFTHFWVLKVQGLVQPWWPLIISAKARF